MRESKRKPAPMVPYVEHYNKTFGWYLFPARMEGGKKYSWLSKYTKPGSSLNWGMSNDPIQLIKNFSNSGYCDKCGIGLPTGEINNLFVVEIDTKEGHDTDGMASLHALEKIHGELPVTLMARSPSGSLHYYFKWPGRKVWQSASKLAPGIDVRGDGGMVVAPPSLRDGVAYEWHNDEAIVDAPDWLTDIVTVSAAEAPHLYAAALLDDDGDDPFAMFAREYQAMPIDVEELLDGISFPGNVHETELLVSASLLNAGMPVDDVVDLIVNEVFARVPASKKWNRKVEIDGVRKMCVGFFIKDDTVLTHQETIPDWLKKKLNGHAAHSEPPAQPTPTAKPAPQIAWPVMDKDAYYGLTGDVVRLIEPQTEADPNAILLQFLTYFGNAIGRGHYYSVERSKHHANLFMILVGDSSKSRKGTSADWLHDLMKGVNSDWAAHCIQNGMSSGEGIIWEIRDDADTVDKDGNIVMGVSRDTRRLFDEREFSRALAMMKREGNVLSHVIRDAWDSRRLSIKTKNNPMTCREPHISICGHITIDELRRDLDTVSMANGYANRFLFVCVKRSKKLPFGGKVAQSAIDALAQRITKRVEALWLVEKDVPMDKQASELWARGYEELSEAKDGLVGSVIARGEAQTVRLALIYALLDGCEEIKLPHLKAGLAVWKYCEDSARFMFGTSIGDGVADTLLQTLQASNAGMTRSDMHALFGRNVSASKISTALLQLQRYGLIRTVTQKIARGRPIETWFAV